MPATIGPAAFEDFARIARTEFLLIEESTSSRSLTRELAWNATCTQWRDGRRQPP